MSLMSKSLPESSAERPAPASQASRGGGCGCQGGAPAPAPVEVSEDAEQSPAELPTDALIDHILERYHRPHLADLSNAVQFAMRVETVHQHRDECPVGLAKHLAFMRGDLESHQAREESVLFPMMLGGGNPMIVFPMSRMQAEHEEVHAQLDELARLTTDFTPPEGACGTWRRLYDLCRKIDADLREHMRLENEVLFARF